MKDETFEKILRAISDLDPDSIDRDGIESALRKELDDEEYDKAVKALREIMGSITEITSNPKKHLLGSNDAAEEANNLQEGDSDQDEGGRTE